MAEYIERTEELMLAMNASARESCEDCGFCVLKTKKGDKK